MALSCDSCHRPVTFDEQRRAWRDDAGSYVCGYDPGNADDVLLVARWHHPPGTLRRDEPMTWTPPPAVTPPAPLGLRGRIVARLRR